MSHGIDTTLSYSRRIALTPLLDSHNFRFAKIVDENKRLLNALQTIALNSDPSTGLWLDQIWSRTLIFNIASTAIAQFGEKK